MAHQEVCCVDVPNLAMQLLLRARPPWREQPVVIVRDDRPQAEVLFVNAHARRQRILPGMTFASARSLAAKLRAAVVSEDELGQTTGEIFSLLCSFSPKVEPGKSGTFWLDPSGLTMLYGSLEQWAKSVLRTLEARGFHASVIVGFHRYRCYALARSRLGAWVVPDSHREARLAGRVALERLALTPELRDGLAVLGVRTLGELLELPVAELKARFGSEAARLHERASDKSFAPLQPRKLIDPIDTVLQFEPPDDDHTRLLFALKGALDDLMGKLARRGQAMATLHLTLMLDHEDDHHEHLEPAAPTLEVLQVVDLVRLRLDAIRLPAGVEGLRVEVEGNRATATQLSVFETQSRRDLDAAARALARLRAAFGTPAVTRAQLRDAHLPEAGYTWQPITDIGFPRAHEREPSSTPLVRQVFPRPIPLPPRPRHEPEAWLDQHGAVSNMHGPYRISGGWWVRTVERDYYYAETQRGDILWIFYDRPRRRWFLHGIVD